MDTLTQELLQQKGKHLENLNYAKELLAYFGARNDGQKYSGEDILQVLDGLNNVSEYVKCLCDNADALELENDELKAK